MQHSQPRAKQAASQQSCTLSTGGTPATSIFSLLKLSITSATLSAADCAPCETLSTRDSALEAAWFAAWSKLRCSLSAPSCRSAKQAQLSLVLSGECHCSVRSCHQALFPAGLQGSLGERSDTGGQVQALLLVSASCEWHISGAGAYTHLQEHGGSLSCSWSSRHTDLHCRILAPSCEAAQPA